MSSSESKAELNDPELPREPQAPLLTQFCGYTTAHGLGRFGAQATRLGRTLWIIFLLGTYGGFTYHMYSLGQQFASVPLSTSLSASLPFEFPDVYICPSDAVTMSQLVGGQDSSAILGDSRCNADCKMMQLAFNSLAMSQRPVAQALGHVIAATEANITDRLLYLDSRNPLTCRTSNDGLEYAGPLSEVQLYSGSVTAANTDLPPYVTRSDCIGWNEAARELRSVWGQTGWADRILAVGFNDSERSCRQLPGLPLSLMMMENATRPLLSAVGCVASNGSGGDFSFRCIADKLNDLTQDACAHCCYDNEFTYMGLSNGVCLCGMSPPTSTLAAKVDGAPCLTVCGGNFSQACGGADGVMSVFWIRDPAPKPLYIPYRPSLSSFNEGPYCFYRSLGRLAATYCSVPYCAMSSFHECLISEGPSGTFPDRELRRYAGQQEESRHRTTCMGWGVLKDRLEGGSLRHQASYPTAVSARTLRAHIETSDLDLISGYCRPAKVVVDTRFNLTDGSSVVRRLTLVDSTWPVCAYSVFDGFVEFSACDLRACHETIFAATGTVRDRLGPDLLASRFGSSLGIGFAGCTFAGVSCGLESFQTLLLPQLGVCHRFNATVNFASLLTSVKPTDARLTFGYFTDATDSEGRQFGNLSKAAAVVSAGLLSAADETRRALRIVVTPRGQYPRPADSLAVAPGQHADLRLRLDRTVRYSKPPQQGCGPPGEPVTYALHTWNTSWGRSLQPFYENVNLTSLYAAQSWSDKLSVLREILAGTETGTRPTGQSLTFPVATQDDCVTAVKVQRFLEACGCLPSHLPIPQHLQSAGHRHCFSLNASLSTASLDRLELCVRGQLTASTVTFLETEARQTVCPQLCDTRAFAVALTTRAWPGLTPETALQFLTKRLTDWTHPFSYLGSRGVGSLYYAHLKAQQYAKLAGKASDSFDFAKFQYQLQMVNERLVKVSVQAASDFGQEIKEEPSYTIRNLMADLGGALGLWSGVSVLTVCELIELLVRIVTHVMTRNRKRVATVASFASAAQQPPGNGDWNFCADSMEAGKRNILEKRSASASSTASIRDTVM